MAFLRARPFLVPLVFLCLYGYGTIDVADFARLSAAPWQLNTDPGKQFLQSSPLPYWLGYPLTTVAGPRWSFAIVMLGGVAFFTLALRRFVAVRYGSRQNDAALMVFATPLLIVLTQYLGKSDAYLAAFLLLLASAASPLWQIVFSGFVIVSHFEIGLLVLLSAMVLRILPIRTTIAGGALGALLLVAYHYYVLPSPPQSRADLGASYLAAAAGAVLATPILHLVWTFGPFWWCVLKARPLGWRWLLVCAATLAIASATLDFTRVFVLVGLPLIISVVDRLAAASRPAAADDAWLHALPLFAFVQAHLLSSYVYDSRIPEIVGRLIQRL